MDSLKRILKSALDDRSPRFMLATIALGVVVALLAGTLIGYKLEKGNSSGTSTPKAKTAKVKKKPPKRKAVAIAAPVLFGTVVSTRPAEIVVVGTKSRVPLVIGSKTTAEVASAGKASSIVVGARVLYTLKTGTTTTASEIVVLPSKSALGAPVTAVSPSTSMTLQGSLVIKTKGATVATTTAGNRARIPKGARVVVAYFTLGRTNGAMEIAILPAGSKL
jgi:hypothetical protein